MTHHPRNSFELEAVRKIAAMDYYYKRSALWEGGPFCPPPPHAVCQ
jgi:hypothetical protein